MEKSIDFTREKHIGRVILNRPDALNALTFPMIKGMYKQLTLWNKDPSIYAVILEAAAGRAFCAGGDVRWLYEAGKKQDPEQLAFFWHEYRLNALIGSFNKPFISLMNGLTMGGGVGVGLHGSHPVATEQFVLAMPETAIGLFPDVGASYLLSQLPQGLGLYFALTGNRVSAADARDLGLVKYVIPAESLGDVVTNLVYLEMDADPLAIDRCFHAFNLEPGVLPTLSKNDLLQIESCFAQASVEAILTSLKEMATPWAIETFSRMQQLSPLSLKVTFKQMQRARHLDLNGCLAMDEMLVKHFMQGHDFYEGVRALLIDKDKTPHWEPGTLAGVSEEQVEGYFL